MVETQPLMSEYEDQRHVLHHEQHHHHIDCNPTIYSALVYAPAVSRIKTGRSANHASKAVCCMIIINTILQLGLLYIMSVYAHRAAQKTFVFDVQGDHQDLDANAAFLPQTNGQSSGATWTRTEDLGRDLLCMKLINGTFTCAPRSVEFTLEWSSLDTNEDGLWTIHEAVVNKGSREPVLMARDEALSKRRMIFFTTIIHSIKQRAEWLASFNRTLYLSKDLLAEQSIPKEYFDFWVGDAMLCTRFDASTCEHIVASGLFNAALQHDQLAARHKGIFDYRSAADYCKMMLSSGCEATLPGESFHKAVREREGICGTATLHDAGILTNPSDPKDLLLLAKPEYDFVEKEALTIRPMFMLFLSMIMYIFYSSLVDEVRDIFKTADFTHSFPSLKHADDLGGVDLGEHVEKRYVIDRISSKHRAAIILVIIVRIAIAVIIIGYGTYFLLMKVSYMELVLNAVALSFIITIDDVLYEVFLESEDKKDVGLDETAKLKFVGKWWPRDDGSCWGSSFRRDCWGVVLLPLITVAIVLAFSFSFRWSRVQALTCACQQEGQACAESIENQGQWWTHYWTHTLPAAIHNIEALRMQGE